LDAHELLLKVKLPDERVKIRILNGLPDVAKAIADDSSCDEPLSYVAETTAKSDDDEWRKTAIRILQPFLDRAVPAIAAGTLPEPAAGMDQARTDSFGNALPSCGLVTIRFAR
jgi:hypothetical protein